MPAPSPLGPIWRAIINALWARLFNPEASNQLYLPRILREGYKPWGLPPYDPATPSGTSQAIPLPGIPQDVADSACSDPDVPVAPIASSTPQLQLTNVLLSNLSQMEPVSLAFSTTAPQFTGTVTIGTAAKPLTLSPANPANSNYFFDVACCVPESEGSRTCTAPHPPAKADGQFTGTGTDAQAAIAIQLNAEGTGPVTVNILNVAITAEPRKVNVDFDVKGLASWAQDMARIAVQEGVGSGAIVQSLQDFLNQPDVKEHLETLVNNALNELPQSSAQALHL